MMLWLSFLFAMVCLDMQDAYLAWAFESRGDQGLSPGAVRILSEHGLLSTF